MGRANRIWGWPASLRSRTPGTARLLTRELAQAYRRGSRAEAVEAARRLVSHLEAEGGMQPEYLGSLNLLALMLWEQGVHDEVEPLLRKALERRRSILGNRHPDYASSLNTLALLLWEKGDADGAEALTRQALDLQVGHSPSPGRPQGRGYLHRLLRAWAGASPMAASLAAGSDDPRGPTCAADAGPDHGIGPSRAAGAGPLPACDECFRELRSLDQQYERLRSRALELADSLGVQPPEEGHRDGLRELRSLLESVAEAEDERSRRDRARRDSLAILDRILGLCHRDRSEFPPLDDCRERACALRSEIVEGGDGPDPEWPERWVDDRHPFATLIRLVDNPADLDDEGWHQAYRIVEESLGRSIAVAAARGLLGLADGHLKFRYNADYSLSSGAG